MERPRARWRRAGLVVVALLAASCATARSTRPSGGHHVLGGTGLVVVMDAATLRAVIAQPSVRSMLGRDHLYELTGPSGATVPGVAGRPTRSFPSEAALAAALAGDGLGHGVQAVLFDDESWLFTPVGEQQQFARYVQAAGRLARSHNLELLANAALDLTGVRGPAARASRYLELGFAAAAARAGAVVVVPAQSLERQPAQYARFVGDAVREARAADKAAIVIASFSMNPPGGPVSLPELESSYWKVHREVDGYWLNVPSPGPHCPACGRPDLGLAFDFERYIATT